MVVAHPSVQTTGIPPATARRLLATPVILLSPTRLLFKTTGSSSCVWWPTRMAVVGPSAIQIDMRVNGIVAKCSAGAVGFPIAVKIDPRVVNVHLPLTVRFAYKVRIPGQGISHWAWAGVAPALPGS